MKKTIKFQAIRRIAGITALVAVIGFSMAGCDDKGGGTPLVVPETSGRLTITDIPSGAIGKYIIAISDDIYAIAANNISGTEEDPIVSGVLNSGDSVELKVWQININDKLVSYSGNDTTKFVIAVLSTPNIHMGDDIESNPALVGGTLRVPMSKPFEGGIGTLDGSSIVMKP